MKDVSLLIVTALGAILVSVCSSDSSSLEGGGGARDEPLRMASESLVVKSYKDVGATSLSPANNDDSSEEYQVYQGVMGKPGIDFPIYPAIPMTSFTCRGVKKSGYYADLETNCQVFHVCDRNRKISFLCPNGTIFRQSHLICDWWFRVDCGKSTELYEESAEQLAADQQIYRARSEEREIRRKKLSKGREFVRFGETTSSQQPSQKERSEVDSEKVEISSSVERQSSRSDRKKSERHSKKVSNFARAQTTFTNGNSNENFSGNRRKEGTKSSVEGGRHSKLKVSFSSSQKPDELVEIEKPVQPSQNIDLGNGNQENFFAAEAGSLAEELSNRSQIFVLENRHPIETSRPLELSYNVSTAEDDGGKEIENFSENNETARQSVYSYNEESVSGFDYGGSDQSGFAYSDSTTTKYKPEPEPEPEPRMEDSTIPVNYYQNNQNFNVNPTYKIQRENFNLGNTFTYPTTIGFRILQNEYSNSQLNETSFQREGVSSTQIPFVASNYEYSQETPIYDEQRQQQTRSEYVERTGSNDQSLFGDSSVASNNQNNNENINFELKTSKIPFYRTNGAVTKQTVTGFDYGSTQRPVQPPHKCENHEFSVTGEGGSSSGAENLNLRNQNEKFSVSTTHLDKFSETSTGSNNLNNFPTSYFTSRQYFGHTNDKENGNYNIYNQRGRTTNSYPQTEGFIHQLNSNSNDTTNYNVGGSNSRNNYEYRNDEYSERQRISSQIKSTDTYKTFKTEEYGDGEQTNIYTTESYESKRTNVLKKESAITGSDISYSSTPSLYQEEERQHLAETASFGSNSEGNNLAGFGNRFRISFNGEQVNGNVGKFYETTYKPPVTVESYLTTRPFDNQYSTATGQAFQTWPKESTKEVTYSSFLPAQTQTINPWPSTTPTSPYHQETPHFNTQNPEEVYFTSTPKTEILNKMDQNTHKSQTNPDFRDETPTSEVNLILQELNINKNITQEPTSDGLPEDFVREGLEVPPSSGPNAIRSFALYFGTTNFTDDNQTEPLETVTHHADLSQVTDTFEIKKKEVVKQVDELVHLSAVNATTEPGTPSVEKLPNSLTHKTKLSYLELFPNEKTSQTIDFEPTETPTESSAEPVEHTKMRDEFFFETTNYGAFTEEPTIINSELGKNDLDSSQTRGLVEPEEDSKTSEKSHVTPNLRRLAQVFTKALSAYLDDPETFKKILSEIRPTEPAFDWEEKAFDAGEYSLAMHEMDEVLDFSDVTTSTQKKGLPTNGKNPVSTNQLNLKEIYNSTLSEVENFIVPTNRTQWATNIELTAPYVETLDESQSSYYTPIPFTKTTNSVAEEINGFISQQKPLFSDTEVDVDSYLPITTTDPTAGKYGGFQNNNKKTTKYSPYGAELASTPYPPIGINSFSKSDIQRISTPEISSGSSANANFTSFFSHFAQNNTPEGEIQLSKQLNNLILLQKFTTPRGTTVESSTVQPHLSTRHLIDKNDTNQHIGVELKTNKAQKNDAQRQIEISTYRSTTTQYINPKAKDINYRQFNSTSNVPRGFYITYSWQETEETTTYQPTPLVTGSSNNRSRASKTLDGDVTTFDFVSETVVPENVTRITHSPTRYYYEFNGAPFETTTPAVAKAMKSLDRIVELQETLMFNTSNSTVEQKDEAREAVDQMMGNVNATSTTTQTLMKMMEIAARNETYKRLVLLLVNDKSAKNKTAEEAKYSLLKALLTPVMRPKMSDVPTATASKSSLELEKETFSEGTRNARKSKSVDFETDGRSKPSATVSTTATKASATTRPLPSTTVEYLATVRPPSNDDGGDNDWKSTKSKAPQVVSGPENSRKKAELENIQLIKKALENSKNNQFKINSVDESAILNSDSRAVELLKSLYSLAARWG